MNNTLALKYEQQKGLCNICKKPLVDWEKTICRAVIENYHSFTALPENLDNNFWRSWRSIKTDMLFGMALPGLDLQAPDSELTPSSTFGARWGGGQARAFEGLSATGIPGGAK